MGNIFNLSAQDIANLWEFPNQPIESRLNGNVFQATLVITNYQQKINDYYRESFPNSLQEMPAFYKTNTVEHFGLRIEFKEALELHAYDDEQTILGNVKELIEMFGIVIFKNVYLSKIQSAEGHKNR